MKKHIFAIFAFACLVLANTPAEAGNISVAISRYDVEAYGNSTGNDKFGIIRLYKDSSTAVVAYLNFHRVTSTMPAARVSQDSSNRVQAHYLSTDWADFLMLLDDRGTLNFTYDATYKTVRLTRHATVTP